MAGHGNYRVTVENEFESDHLVDNPPADEIVSLDDALTRLAVEQPRLAELVQLKHFGGLTLAESAEILGVSARTADTWWAYARAWLAVDLKKS
jgi:DNA-directed RNA polymerase specialized sigma24 family protein